MKLFMSMLFYSPGRKMLQNKIHDFSVDMIEIFSIVKISVTRPNKISRVSATKISAIRSVI